MYFSNEMIYSVTINQCKAILFSIFFITMYILYKIIFKKKSNRKQKICQEICNEIKTILHNYYADQLDNIKSSENRIIKIHKNLLELYNEKKCNISVNEYIDNRIDDYIKLKENETEIKNKYEENLKFNYAMYNIFDKKIIPQIIKD